MALTLLHPGCLELGWDDGLVALGLGHLWRRGADGAWSAEPARPLHTLGDLGPPRRVVVEGAFVYTEGPWGWRATASVDGDAVLAHPCGAVAFARHGVVHRAAQPGRTPVDVPELRADSLRFAPGGLLGLGADGPAAVDLDRGVARPLPGLPLGPGVHLVDGEVRAGDEVVARGLLEASPAVGPSHLAGPGGALWPLHGGPPSAARPIALGATTPLATGFATVGFEAREGVVVGLDGRPLRRFAVPLDADDVVVALRVQDGTLVAQTAWGHALRLLDGIDPAPGQGSDAAGPVSTPLGFLDDAVAARHRDRCYAASEAGWLLAWDA